MYNKRQMKQEKLFMELQSIENRGITIWLEGYVSNSKRVAEAMCVNEQDSYMRDYVFQEGRLQQVRFDRVTE